MKNDMYMELNEFSIQRLIAPIAFKLKTGGYRYG